MILCHAIGVLLRLSTALNNFVVSASTCLQELQSDAVFASGFPIFELPESWSLAARS